MPVFTPIAVLLLASVWRIVAASHPELANFAPVMALTFCSAVYLRDKRLWALPFAALALSDLFLDHYYATQFGEQWTWPSVLVRTGCFTLALPLGAAVARRKNWLTLFSGAIASSFIFYFATNTDAWLRDPFYAKTASGWWQAITSGHPEFMPTFFFFRNTLLSDVVFTGLFAAAFEYAALRAAQPSLWVRGNTVLNAKT